VNLYKLARTVQTVKVIASGDPKRIARRGRNIVKGRALAKVGFWKWLWK
jgi:hypothetical protein